MEQPSALVSYAEWLKSDIQRTSVINWRILHGNAERHVQNILANVIVTPEFQEACDTAVARAREYAEELRDHGFARQDDPAIENAKKVALQAADKLIEALHKVNFNAQARHLGF